MSEVKLVLRLPDCDFCYDRHAVAEVITTWGWWADLCAECAARIGGVRWLELRAGPAQPPLLTAAKAGAYVESQKFKRARATFRGRPQAPHEYVLLKRSADPEMHLRVVSFIRQQGQTRRFGGVDYSYWTWGDYEYWAAEPVHTILNRRHLDWPTTA